MEKAVVLLSAGLDSAVNFFMANQEFDVVLALTFNYGQKAAEKEIAAAKALCERLGVRHEVLNLDWLGKISASSLTDSSKDIPVGDSVSIDDLHVSLETKKSVWVPNRNGVLLNIAASFAESLGAKYVIPGFNKEEATTFPDNSKEYMTALDQSFSFSTENSVEVKCFTVDMTKPEIVGLGRKLEVPFDQLWPCYFDGEEICRECESCKRFLRAMESEQ